MDDPEKKRRRNGRMQRIRVDMGRKKEGEDDEEEEEQEEEDRGLFGSKMQFLFFCERPRGIEAP